MPYPQWATPKRRARLVKLFRQSGGFCIHGHKPCPIPSHHYEYYIEGLIKDWVADDKSECHALWRRERRLMHRMPEQGRWKRRFDPVARETFQADRPSHYVEAVGVSGLTFTRIARVRVSGTQVRLFVDVAASQLSKNQRRKMRRYGHQEPPQIEDLCHSAVKDFWAKLD